MPTPNRCFSASIAFPIYFALTVATFNQLAGINAILYYLNYIFAMAGFSKASGDVQAVAVGAMNLVATLLAMSVIDSLGRKTLLLIGAVGHDNLPGGVVAIISSPTNIKDCCYGFWSSISRSSLFRGRGHLGIYQRGFPQPRALQGPEPGQLNSLDHELAHFWNFPLLGGALAGGYPFVFFAAMMARFFVVLFTFPETKGVTLEEMQQGWELSTNSMEAMFARVTRICDLDH